MNRKIGMFASIISFLCAFCFSIFFLLGRNKFNIGIHLSCIFMAPGFIAMICSYIAFLKDENKSTGLISFAFSIIYAIITVILGVLWIIPNQFTHFSSATKDIFLVLEIIGYVFMAMSSFFIGIKLETRNRRDLFLKLLLCFQLLFSVIWFIILVFLTGFINPGNIYFILFRLMFEIWCIYIMLICIFSFLYFSRYGVKETATLHQEMGQECPDKKGREKLRIFGLVFLSIILVTVLTLTAVRSDFITTRFINDNDTIDGVDQENKDTEYFYQKAPVCEFEIDYNDEEHGVLKYYGYRPSIQEAAVCLDPVLYPYFKYQIKPPETLVSDSWKLQENNTELDERVKKAMQRYNITFCETFVANEYDGFTYIVNMSFDNYRTFDTISMDSTGYFLSIYTAFLDKITTIRRF